MVLVVDFFLEMTFFATILSIDIQRLEVCFFFFLPPSRLRLRLDLELISLFSRNRIASQLADLLTQGHHHPSHQRHLPSTPSDLDEGELLDHELESTTKQHLVSFYEATKGVLRDRAARTTTFGCLFLIDGLLYLA